VENNLLLFWRFWPNFVDLLQMLPRLKIFSEKSKCAHHPHTTLWSKNVHLFVLL